MQIHISQKNRRIKS